MLDVYVASQFPKHTSPYMFLRQAIVERRALVLLAGYYLLLDILGMVVTSALALLTFMLLGGERRAVPVGQSYYDEAFLPEEYRHNLLVARWGIRQLSR